MYPLDLTLSLPCWFNSWDLTVSPDFTWAIGFIEIFLPVLGEGRDHCFREQYSRLPGFIARIFFCSKRLSKTFFVSCQIWRRFKHENVLSMMEWWRGFQDGFSSEVWARWILPLLVFFTVSGSSSWTSSDSQLNCASSIELSPDAQVGSASLPDAAFCIIFCQDFFSLGPM